MVTRVEVQAALVDFWAQPLVVFVAVVAASLLVAKGVLFLLTHYVKRWAHASKTRLYERLLEAGTLPIYLALLCSGLYLAYRVSFGEVPWLDSAGKVAFVLVSAVSLVRLIDALFDWYRDDVLVPRNVATDVTFLIGRIIKSSIVVVFAIMALDVLGIAVTPLVASLGIAGLAAALAFQDTLSNFFAGVYLTADHPVRIGDFVQLESGQEGTVSKIGWRSTFLHTVHGNTVVLPNSKMAQAVLVNFSEPQPEMFLEIPFVVPRSDVASTKRVLLDEVQALQLQVKKAASAFRPFVRYASLDGQDVELVVTLQIRSYSERFSVRHAFFKAIAARLNRPLERRPPFSGAFIKIVASVQQVFAG